jgi:hypothetical protein
MSVNGRHVFCFSDITGFHLSILISKISQYVCLMFTNFRLNFVMITQILYKMHSVPIFKMELP